MRVLTHALVLWLPLAAAITGAFVFAYWGIQQEYRMSLNDPQIQMAEGLAIELSKEQNPSSVSLAATTDIATALDPWIAVYDASGTPVASTGRLAGALPTLPHGVFDTSTWHHYGALGVPVAVPLGEDRFTWQPSRGVRQAVVLIAVPGNRFVAAGRNMREIESRIATLTTGAALAWLGTLAGAYIVLAITVALGARRKSVV